MTVLEELLVWSQDRPAWQRDALRRLVSKGELSEADIVELAEICKGSHGLAEPRAAQPLAQTDIPEQRGDEPPISLVSIFHHRGVNALAEDQTLRFGPKLTVVYGDNAAGKTGYTRILKTACRARGQEQILGNVVSGEAPLAPVVSIKYRVGQEPEPREWPGAGDDRVVSRVSVFDSQSASVYLTEKTDVAFRPFGLDIFDKLVKACRAVRARLEEEQRALPLAAVAAIRPLFSEGSAVAKLLANITSLTPPDAVQRLATLSADDEGELALAEKSLLDLRANDPEQLARLLAIRVSRVRALGKHIRAVEAALSPGAIDGVFETRAQGRQRRKDAKLLGEATFAVGKLEGTGSETWAALWEAARRFSLGAAYPHEAFPFVGEAARCVLCQQGLDDDARSRLEQFERFAASTTEVELRELRERFANLRKALVDLQVLPQAVAETLEEIRLEHESVWGGVTEALGINEARRAAVVQALGEDGELPNTCPALASCGDEVDALAEMLATRITTLRAGATTEVRKRLETAATELRARQLLGKHQTAVLNEIEARKRHAAFGLCIAETTTRAITQKSAAVTHVAVSEKLKQRFRDELASLHFRRIEVELKEAGGAEGVLYHKLVLTRAPGLSLPNVVSEGEQRCLSIAAFFAELATAADLSAIVFDDPVSSLDYRWREAVALRLVEEAKRRQVIVFTHDVVFLLLLKQYAQTEAVEQLDQHVLHLSNGAGVCVDALPWVALPVRKKIGHLKSEWQRVDKLFRDGNQAAYEKEAKFLYGLLREAWERGLEEVLLGGIVERFRPGIQTQQIEEIADITEEDCGALQAAMTKCSRWLPGHDEAPAARAPVPEPAELQADVATLENWVTAIRGRRR